MNKKILFLIIFGMVMFGIRLFNINEAIYDDESNFAYSLTVMDKFGFNHDYSSPNLLNVLYKPLISMFGLKTWVFRLVPWLFGILNTLLVYFLVKRNFNQKAAFWATILMLIAFYPTLASLQFDVEGNLVMFSILLMFFAYLKYGRTNDKRKQLGWQMLAGLGIGVAVISKYNSVYIVLPLTLYVLIKRKNFKQLFNDLFPIYLTGLILFLANILLGIIASPQNWLNFVPIFSWSYGFAGYYNTGSFEPLGLGIFILWTTPLLLSFYFVSMKKENLLFLLWITFALLFYTFVMGNGSIDRYLMNTIPALAILGGIFISKINFKKTHFLFGSVLFVIFTILLFLINTFPMKQVARFPSLYVQELKQLNLNFLFVFTSASGPTFGVNFATIFWSFLISFGYLFLYLLFKKEDVAKWFFVGFLSISLAFNVFLVSEYLFHPTGVDVSKVKWEMVNFVKEKDLPYPIYSADSGILWSFDNFYWRITYQDTPGKVVDLPDNELDFNVKAAVEEIKLRKGTIILLHWPPLPKNGPIWKIVDECNLNRQFIDKRKVVGEVYVC